MSVYALIMNFLEYIILISDLFFYATQNYK